MFRNFSIFLFEWLAKIVYLEILFEIDMSYLVKFDF